MRIGLFFAFAGVLLVSLSEGRLFQSSILLRRSGPHLPLYRNLQVSKRQYLERKAAHQKRAPEPTPTTPDASDAKTQPIRRQYYDRGNAIRQKVHFYLNQCHSGLQRRVRNVTSLCSGDINNENATRIAWKLLAELQAILALCLACARAVKGCPSEPTPSGTPGGGGGGGASTADICQLLFQIISQLRLCFQQMNTTCSQYEVISNICNETLHQISGALSNCVAASGNLVGGAIPGLNQLMGGQNMPSFFGPIKYGLHQVVNVLQSL